jgi:hypothetical protein
MMGRDSLGPPVGVIVSRDLGSGDEVGASTVVVQGPTDPGVLLAATDDLHHDLADMGEPAVVAGVDRVAEFVTEGQVLGTSGDVLEVLGVLGDRDHWVAFGLGLV